MDMHQSSIITVLLGCVFATQADASNKLDSLADSCTILVVHISERILDDYIITVDQMVIEHGYLEGFQTKYGKKNYLFSQAEMFGPDVTLPFIRKTDGEKATIRVQQNFCFWEAGSITVKPIRAPIGGK
ncbi:MAG: hypothetical protein LPD71_07250, partial [Shewanella sp.]|nr:hypothetical protein [Shewanella sp.]